MVAVNLASTCRTGGDCLAGKKFSFRLCPETEDVLAAVPLETRSAYVREAILFYHGQGSVLKRIENKLDRLADFLGERIKEANLPTRKPEEGAGDADMELYLFSGQSEILEGK